MFLSDIAIKLLIRSSGTSIGRSDCGAEADDIPKFGGAVAEPAPKDRYESKLYLGGPSKSSDGYSDFPGAEGLGY